MLHNEMLHATMYNYNTSHYKIYVYFMSDNQIQRVIEVKCIIYIVLYVVCITAFCSPYVMRQAFRCHKVLCN